VKSEGCWKRSACSGANHPSIGNPGAAFSAKTLNTEGMVRSYNGYGCTAFTSRHVQVGAVLRLER